MVAFLGDGRLNRWAGLVLDVVRRLRLAHPLGRRGHESRESARVHRATFGNEERREFTKTGKRWRSRLFLRLRENERARVSDVNVLL